jgi:hypothetical protein
VQFVAPSALMRPAAQDMHSSDPLFDALPASHVLQALDRAALYFPLGHTTQKDDFSALRRPPAHSVHAVARGPENVPASHTVQFVSATGAKRTVLYVPLGQAEQFRCPKLLKYPPGHSEHSEASGFANVPASHT